MLAFMLVCGTGVAQKSGKPAQEKAPPMRVNILNVCAPGEAEQKEIAAALARVPRGPSFGKDYEVTRGHTTGEDGTGSDWVRIRREFPRAMPLLAVQYSYSTDPNEVRETSVFYSREAKDVMQIALEDEVPPGAGAADILAANTPVSHIRIERYGKPSLVLARCPQADQSAFEPLFRTASELMEGYRARLNAKQVVPGELGRGAGGGRRPVQVKPMVRRGGSESK